MQFEEYYIKCKAIQKYDGYLLVTLNVFNEEVVSLFAHLLIEWLYITEPYQYNSHTVPDTRLAC